MCVSSSVYDLVVSIGVMVLFGWMWWVMFNAGE
jgi:hypothetical protein